MVTCYNILGRHFTFLEIYGGGGTEWKAAVSTALNLMGLDEVIRSRIYTGSPVYPFRCRSLICLSMGCVSVVKSNKTATVYVANKLNQEVQTNAEHKFV